MSRSRGSHDRERGLPELESYLSMRARGVLSRFQKNINVFLTKRNTPLPLVATVLRKVEYFLTPKIVREIELVNLDFIGLQDLLIILGQAMPKYPSQEKVDGILKEFEAELSFLSSEERKQIVEEASQIFRYLFHHHSQTEDPR